MSRSWIAALAALEADGQPAVLVTVLAARGSTPREAGCKMVVAADSLHGTIGGGSLEHRCAALARAMLADPPAAPVTHDFPLGPALGQCCGGHASLLFEPVMPVAWPIALFGAGHVGRALVRVLGELPCRITWIDPRADAFPAAKPANTRAVIAAQPDIEASRLTAGSTVLVMTHDHQLDFDIVAACLRRDDLASIGLIGSETKRARFAGRLARAGLDPARLICPIGIAGAGGKLPAEIAVSVAAQLLQLRDAATLAAPVPLPLVAACDGCTRVGVAAR